VVNFELRFRRPFPSVQLTVERSTDVAAELLARVDFVVRAEDAEKAGGLRVLDGGRREETLIGYQTFMKIAEVMRS